VLGELLIPSIGYNVFSAKRDYDSSKPAKKLI
jgi:hypothetical protein